MSTQSSILEARGGKVWNPYADQTSASAQVKISPMAHFIVGIVLYVTSVLSFIYFFSESTIVALKPNPISPLVLEVPDGTYFTSWFWFLLLTLASVALFEIAFWQLSVAMENGLKQKPLRIIAMILSFGTIALFRYSDHNEKSYNTMITTVVLLTGLTMTMLLGIVNSSNDEIRTWQENLGLTSTSISGTMPNVGGTALLSANDGSSVRITAKKEGSNIIYTAEKVTVETKDTK